MGVFSYEALDGKGKRIKGVVDADSESHAVTKLRARGVYPTKLRSGEEGTKNPSLLGGRVGTRQVAAFTRQMATLLEAGFQVVEALSLVSNGTSDMALKGILVGIREKVKEGSKLCEALREHPKLFDSLYVNMVLAGEESSQLQQVLENLADYLERRNRFRRKLLSMIAYPVTVSFVGAGIVIFLLTYTVPTLTEIFLRAKQELPLSTEILIFISHGLARWWWALGALAGALFLLLRSLLNTSRGRAWTDRVRLSLPLAGFFFRQLALGRFARTLSVLLDSGVSILRSLEIVAQVVDNKHMERAIDTARQEISQGARISDALQSCGLFPRMFLDMVEAGQRSSKLPQMLARSADDADDSVETILSTFVAMLEPALILLMGGLVFFIVMAVILPIFEMNRMTF